MITKIKWNLESIKIGLERFKNEFGRYPSTLDFDKVDYLPSSRMIQRNFGGIVNLKRELKLDGVLDYTKGEYRSGVASKLYKDAVKYEEDFYNYLISVVEEIRVHEHKILRPGHICCDFFVYTKASGGIAIDIFYAQDLQSFARVIGNKFRRYCQLPHDIYFVLVGNHSIGQEDIDSLMKNRKIKITPNIKIKNELEFKKYFEQIQISR